MRRLFIPVLAILAVPGLMAAQRGGAPPGGRALFSTDSIQIGLVSPSPDGRWLAFDGTVHGRSSLYIVPSGGGEPRKLFADSFDDRHPRWYPRGDRIAFLSSRVNGVMSIAVDPARGVTIGSPARVSLDPCNMFDVSPDGRRIACFWGAGNVRPRLTLLPSTGGPARTLVSGTMPLDYPRFSRNSDSVYYTAMPAQQSGTSMLMAVAVDGGRPRTVLRRPRSVFMGLLADPVADRVYARSAPGTDRDYVLRLNGDTVGTVPKLGGPIFVSYTPDGRVLKSRSRVSANIRLVPLGGGAPVDVTPVDDTNYYYPNQWTRDGRLLVEGETGKLFLWNSAAAPAPIDIHPVNAPAGWAAPDTPWSMSPDGSRLILRVPSARGFSFSSYDVNTRRLTPLVEGAEPGTSAWFDSRTGNLYLSERRGSSIVVSQVADGAPRLVGTVPAATSGNANIAVFGPRVVYSVPAGDSTVYFVAGASGRARRILAVPGSFQQTVFSADGRFLAAHGSRGSRDYVLIVPFDSATARPAGAARLVPTDAVWDLAFTPDNQSIVAIQEDGMSNRTRIIRIPVQPGGRVTTIGPTGQTFWDAFLSPDGKYVAIPLEHDRGATLWSLPVTRQ